jgi:hypothetical protein
MTQALCFTRGVRRVKRLVLALETSFGLIY